MFYLKEKTGSTTVNVEITDENIFTVCPKCGREHHLDLEDFYFALDIDPDLGILCGDCADNGINSIYRKAAEHDQT